MSNLYNTGHPRRACSPFHTSHPAHASGRVHPLLCSIFDVAYGVFAESKYVTKGLQGLRSWKYVNDEQTPCALQHGRDDLIGRVWNPSREDEFCPTPLFLPDLACRPAKR